MYFLLHITVSPKWWQQWSHRISWTSKQHYPNMALHFGLLQSLMARLPITIELCSSHEFSSIPSPSKMDFCSRVIIMYTKMRPKCSPWNWNPMILCHLCFPGCHDQKSWYHNMWLTLTATPRLFVCRLLQPKLWVYLRDKKRFLPEEQLHVGSVQEENKVNTPICCAQRFIYSWRKTVDKAHRLKACGK